MKPTTTQERTNTVNYLRPLSGLILPALWWGYLLVRRPQK